MMNRESLLSVLMYMFENYYEQNQEVHSHSEAIADDMLKAGFERKDIDRALEWFKELTKIHAVFVDEYPIIAKDTTRIYTCYEMDKITVKARSYLYFLEHSGIIDPVSREIILDRIMALEETVIDLPELKWVALMVLFSQSDKQEQLKLLEELVLFCDHDALQH